MKMKMMTATRIQEVERRTEFRRRKETWLEKKTTSVKNRLWVAAVTKPREDRGDEDDDDSQRRQLRGLRH